MDCHSEGSTRFEFVSTPFLASDTSEFREISTRIPDFVNSLGLNSLLSIDTINCSTKLRVKVPRSGMGSDLIPEVLDEFLTSSNNSYWNRLIFSGDGNQDCLKMEHHEYQQGGQRKKPVLKAGLVLNAGL